MEKAVDLIFIQHNYGILLVKKKNLWILPGGKPEEKENDYECLKREIMEELKTKVSIKNFYKTFNGVTPFSNRLLEVNTYFGFFINDMIPSREISDARFVSNPSEYPLSDITKKIIKSLRQDRYLNG